MALWGVASRAGKLGSIVGRVRVQRFKNGQSFSFPSVFPQRLTTTSVASTLGFSAFEAQSRVKNGYIANT